MAQFNWREQFVLKRYQSGRSILWREYAKTRK